jgi:O-antigen/teichoic acid export membrane protein
VIQHWIQRVSGNKLVSGVIVYTLASVLNRSVAILLIPLYTIYLLPEEYGVVGSVVVIAGLLAQLVDMGLVSAVSRHYYEIYKDASRVVCYIRSVLCLKCLAFVGLALLAWWCGEPLWNRLVSGRIPYRPYIDLVIGLTIFGNLAEFGSSYLRVLQKPLGFLCVNLSQMLVNVIVALIFLAVLGMKAEGVLLGRVVAAAVVVVGMVLWAGRKVPVWGETSAADMKRALWFGLPLVPHFLANWAKGAADKIILLKWCSLEEVGFYNLAYSMALVMPMLITAFDAAFAPYYYKLREDQGTRCYGGLRRFSAAYALGLGGLCIAGVWLVEDLMRWFVSNRFAESTVYVPILILSYFYFGLYTQVVKGILYRKRTRLLPWLTGLPVLAAIGANIVLIPIAGAFAAAWVTVALNVVIFVCVYWACRTVDDLPPDIMAPVIATVALFAAYALSLRVESGGLKWVWAFVVLLIYAGASWAWLRRLERIA